LRLGVYADLLYRRDEAGISADRAFVKFVTALPPRVEEVVVFGRLDPEPGSHPYRLPREAVRFVAFPHYGRLWELGDVARALSEARRRFASELERLDAVLVFGPHPVAIEFIRIAQRRGTPLVLGIRQDYPRYVRERLPSRAWGWVVPGAYALDYTFRLLSRSIPTVVVGSELARVYGRGGAPILPLNLSLVPAAEVVSFDDAISRARRERATVLSVGRLDPEKNPLLLLDVAERLERARSPLRLAVAGDGPMRSELERSIAARGIEERISLLGYVPNGPQLWEVYRQSDILLHVSLTEGLPQVLVEAQAAGVPIVATAVGGVADALGDAALLVPPGDADAILAALARLEDAQLRRDLVERGLRLAREATLEAQLDRLAQFLHNATAQPRG